MNRLEKNILHQARQRVYTKLNSVGCILETNRGIVYPMNENGTPDLSCPIGLRQDEVSYEWLSELSSNDYKKVLPYIS
jgi:hypothetical protein